MHALLLAAGLGTRLLPLTENQPKALVKVGNDTLLKIAINNLARQGIERIVVNVHHFADMICDYIASHQWPVPVTISDERSLLLDTGGAIAHAAPLLEGADYVVVHNVDIISDVDLRAMQRQISEDPCLALLATSQRESSRHLIFDQQNQLVGRHIKADNSYEWVDAPRKDGISMAFSGIAMIDPNIISLLPPDGSAFPIIPQYLRLAKEHPIRAFVHSADNWLDVGKKETLSKASDLLHRIQL